jgi:hypothetical protein
VSQLDICDGCSADLSGVDRFHLVAGLLAVGMIQIDLCPDCAAPFWESPIGQTLLARAQQVKADENARRAAVMQSEAPAP